MRFVSLNDPDLGECHINAAHIVRVRRSKDGVMVKTTDGMEYCIKDQTDLDQVTDFLSRYAK